MLISYPSASSVMRASSVSLVPVIRVKSMCLQLLLIESRFECTRNQRLPKLLRKCCKRELPDQQESVVASLGRLESRISKGCYLKFDGCHMEILNACIEKHSQPAIQNWRRCV